MIKSVSRISGYIVDILNRRTFPGEIHIENGRIRRIEQRESVIRQFILPGFIDAHVHIESSMLVPSEFARMAVVHGTVATVSDPHEIANVLGATGVDYMLKNGRQVPFKFNFGAPSCVPATSFETAGAELGPVELDALLKMPEIKYLAEMMNWPGVIHHDPVVMKKLEIAAVYGKPIDGHAPGLTREQAEVYIKAGITTDHECVAYDEAKHKINHGMHIIIREGSAAKNFDALIDLLPEFEDRIMFCSDDKHPDNLEEGHINLLVRRAVQQGIDVFSVLKAACTNPIRHYGLEVGQLRENDPADFIVVDNLADFKVRQTVINGMEVASGGKTNIERTEIKLANNFNAVPVTVKQLQVKALGKKIRAIAAFDGQLITREEICDARIVDGLVEGDVSNDLLKIVVVNRYTQSQPAVAFIRNFGIKDGAIASSVAHDSHNIIAVGVDDVSIARAIHLIMEVKGGISAVGRGREASLPLPVAGIMSDDDGYAVARRYKEMDKMAREMGSGLRSPYMTLSFMALLVIPSLKLSDRGLFDGNKFGLTSLFLEADL